MRVRSPVWPLFSERGYAGLAVEGDPSMYVPLHKHMKAANSSKNIHVLWGFAFPDTIADRLRQGGAPQHPDVLKVGGLHATSTHTAYTQRTHSVPTACPHTLLERSILPTCSLPDPH